MQLQPKDLGKKSHIAVVRYRALGTARISMPPHLGTLGKIWSRGLKISPDVLAATLPMMADQVGPLVNAAAPGAVLAALAFFFIFGISALPVAVVFALISLYLFLIFLPRRVVQRLHTAPVEWEELEALKGSEVKAQLPDDEKRPARPVQLLKNLSALFDSVRGIQPQRRSGELERAYFSLVQEALETRDLTLDAEAELRGVLATIGDTVGSLPAEDAIEEDVADVLGDAEMLAARAQREKDEVIAQSLLRQADSHMERARAIENNKRLARRVRILREEMLSQVKMVKSLLPAFRERATLATTEQDRFTHVSETVRGIAVEADSVTKAREELAQVLWKPTPETEQQVVKVGKWN